MLIVKKILFTTLFLVVAGTGVAFSLKAAVGVGAWDAFSQATSLATGIKVGTFSMFMNLSCVLLQLIILKKDFKPLATLQIGMAILLGVVVNFVFYDILGNVSINVYFINLMMLILSLLVVIVAVALIMSIDFLSFPLEAACMAVAEKTTISFGRIRQLVDVFAIIGAIILSILFSNPIPVREGTFIGMALFGPLVAKFMISFKPLVKNAGLLD